VNETSGLVFLIPVAGILGAFTMIALGMISATKRQELRMRERLAMIERGLTPPPEVDPEGFDRVTGSTQRDIRRRFVGAGIIVIGIGLGVALIIGVAGDQLRVAVGVGGAIVVIGLAMLVNGLINTGS
jgi:hypothetical protein